MYHCDYCDRSYTEHNRKRHVLGSEHRKRVYLHYKQYDNDGKFLKALEVPRCKWFEKGKSQLQSSKLFIF